MRVLAGKPFAAVRDVEAEKLVNRNAGLFSDVGNSNGPAPSAT
jgi:hypothetical protein